MESVIIISVCSRLIAKSAILIKSPQSLKYANTAYDLYKGSNESLKKYQQKLLFCILEDSAKNVPYYKEIFKDVSINSISETEKYLEMLPVLNKDIIRDNFDKLSSNNKHRRPYINTSGGSTGEPVRFLQDKEYYSKNFGDKILFGMLNDKLPGDFEVKLWGSERDVIKGSIGIKEKIINFIYNREFINSFIMDDSHMMNAIQTICKKKPVQIWSYADSIYELSKYILSNNITVFSPKNIITTAGVLYPEMRQIINLAFPNSRVLNQYGSREVGVIGIEIGGGECIRVFDHSVYLEVLTDNGKICKEGTGQLLVTSLINYSMPLIRFNIGDVATISKVDPLMEGSFSLITNLQGRVNSHFKRDDGKIIHGEYFTHIFYNKDWIKNFQVIQNSYYDIDFLLELKKDTCANEDDINSMKKDVEAVMGKCNINIRYVKEIPKLDSGKYQFVISKV